jgi:hypothetical protein
MVRQGKGSHEIWHSPITQRNFPYLSAFQVATPPMLSSDKPACRKHFNRDDVGTDFQHPQHRTALLDDLILARP